jgi:3-oxoacyl-[acyl-carrier protein] reductase
MGVPNHHLETLKTTIPLGRHGTVEEAAGVILFLSSPLSDYVSGQIVEMAGGL